MKVPSSAKMSKESVAGNKMGARGTPAGGRAPAGITGKMTPVGIAGNTIGGKGSPAGGRAPGSITGKLPKGKA